MLRFFEKRSIKKEDPSGPLFYVLQRLFVQVGFIGDVNGAVQNAADVVSVATALAAGQTAAAGEDTACQHLTVEDTLADGSSAAAGEAGDNHPMLTAVTVLCTEEYRFAGLQLAVDGF